MPADRAAGLAADARGPGAAEARGHPLSLLPPHSGFACHFFLLIQVEASTMPWLLWDNFDPQEASGSSRGHPVTQRSDDVREPLTPTTTPCIA